MRPESGFPIAPNWQKIKKIAMKSQFSDMASSSIFFKVYLLVRVSCQYHHLFWSYDNFLL